MSRPRLQALLDALAVQHWEFTPPQPPADPSADRFRLEGGEMEWTLRRGDGCLVELTFWAVTHLGESTNDVRDIFWCRVKTAPEIKLYFSKINTDEWHQELQQFVWSIQKFCKSPV